RYEKLMLATGARERFLPFPGWTLPHVLGAGGLQALAKGSLPLAGKRVVVAGAGPLLLAVAAYLRQHGAAVAAVCDQASWTALARFSLALPAKKLVQAAQLGRSLQGVPIWMNAWPVEARPGGVVIHRSGQFREIACDYLACGFHLVPNTELAALLGCATQRGAVVVDGDQQTTIAGIYCAGEPTGIGGVELALAQGEIAGLAAAGRAAPAALRLRREKLRRFALRLERVTSLRPELRRLPRPETLVCRCEDVPFARLQEHTAWRAAKLHTRCGMGPCQGRVCGPACEFLLGWQPDSVRPPIFPATLSALGNEPGRY
ncbi:MAG: FAD-dependent oxidoreductase, partial [Terriglobales bacterium]